MKPITIFEYGKIPRSEIPASILRIWQRFDEYHARTTGETVFDWNHVAFVKAKSYVGVVQIGPLQIEILPKIDASDESGLGEQSSRQNLLYMLSMAGRVPLLDRDFASQNLRRLPLWEALVQAFATRTLAELRRGQQYNYLYREEELTFIRGRVLVHQQICRSAGSKHRLQVGYDEFSCETVLNIILKATSLRLLKSSRRNATQQLLRETLLELADVPDLPIQLADFDRVQLDRASERFRPLLEFCRLVWLGTTPTPELGGNPCFSLLFPMETVFEQFVGNFLRRYASPLGLDAQHVHLQGKSQQRWLLRDKSGYGKFRLKPDILVSRADATPQLILDTKWKRLKSDNQDSKNGVLTADIYQLYAYATRYQCRDNILLYPRVPGVTPKSYYLDKSADSRIRTEFIDLSYDLYGGRERLIHELGCILAGASQ